MKINRALISKIGTILIPARGVFIKKWKVLLITAVLAYLLIDYYDFGLAVGWGIFSKQYKPNLVEGIVAIFLLLTLWATWRTSREAVRQTEITLRPYMRLSWRNDVNNESREDQGIIDTCIVVSNNGKGLMRKVWYKVEIDNQRVKVRRHPIIIPGDSTVMVYADSEEDLKLGCRNKDVFYDCKDINSEIILNKKIRVSGSYRDVEGREYFFEFVSDKSQQSWFRETRRQDLFQKHKEKTLL